MTFQSKNLGNLGEDIATKYLKKHGFKILDRNFRYKGYGEIDIIAKKDKNLHFVEVKTREIKNDIYTPEDNITFFKQKQLIKLSKIYLVKNHLNHLDIPWQIDVIAVEINSLTRKAKVRYIGQAVEDFQ